MEDFKKTFASFLFCKSILERNIWLKVCKKGVFEEKSKFEKGKDTKKSINLGKWWI